MLRATTERHQSTLAPQSHLGTMEEKYWPHTNGTLVLNHIGAVLIVTYGYLYSPLPNAQ